MKEIYLLIVVMISLSCTKEDVIKEEVINSYDYVLTNQFDSDSLLIDITDIGETAIDINITAITELDTILISLSNRDILINNSNSETRRLLVDYSIDGRLHMCILLSTFETELKSISIVEDNKIKACNVEGVDSGCQLLSVNYNR